MYCKKVMEHFKEPKNAGEIEKPDGVGRVGNPACGDVMEMYIRVEGSEKELEKRKIKEIKFKTFGCCAAIASSDAVCELAKGKTIKEALKLDRKDVVEFLEELPAIKIHCSILGIDALRKAIENYKTRAGIKKC
jgi:nitrogen fixation NifU-like protein